jgi:hydrogenase nickel incorporation protein HypA/HybF
MFWMHEVAVMSQIIELVLSEAKKRDAEQVSHVKLEIGEYTFLGEEQMRFAFEVLSKGTVAEGAYLDITTRKGVVECPCGYSGAPEQPEDIHILAPILMCPKCGKIANVKEGLGCTVRDISMVVPDVQA